MTYRPRLEKSKENEGASTRRRWASRAAPFGAVELILKSDHHSEGWRGGRGGGGGGGVEDVGDMTYRLRI
jgi:hypothetical protein